MGRCFCTSGCAGADEVCTKTPYARVGNGTIYKIRNARWPEYYVDVDMSGQVDVESRNTDESDNEFFLLKPGYAGGESPLAAPIFLIASQRWPDSVLGIIQNQDNQDSYTTTCRRVSGGLGGFLADPSVKELGLYLTAAPTQSADEKRTLVMISSYLYPSKFMYVRSVGFGVAVSEADPGAGGYWFFEPNLPTEIKAILLRYVGPRCAFSCGEVSAAPPHEASISAMSVALAIAWRLSSVV